MEVDRVCLGTVAFCHQMLQGLLSENGTWFADNALLLNSSPALRSYMACLMAKLDILSDHREEFSI
jgi:hypothetical protein